MNEGNEEIKGKVNPFHSIMDALASVGYEVVSIGKDAYEEKRVSPASFGLINITVLPVHRK